MADCCLIKKVATVEVYENKNEVRAYGFMAGDRNTPVMEVRFKHLWGESNLSTCKLRWIIVDDVGSLLVGEVPIQSDNTALINLPNELFTGDRRMKVQLTVASCDGERILNLQQFTDLKVINSLATNEVVQPVYQLLINQLYDDTKVYLSQLETSYSAKYGSLETLYANSKASLEQYLVTAENGGNAEFLQGYAPHNFKKTEDTIANLKASTKYKLGDVVEVLGFHTKGDGSHHKRIAKVEDDGSGEQGQNGIWWCIVYENFHDKRLTTKNKTVVNSINELNKKMFFEENFDKISKKIEITYIKENYSFSEFFPQSMYLDDNEIVIIVSKLDGTNGDFLKLNQTGGFVAKKTISDIDFTQGIHKYSGFYYFKHRDKNKVFKLKEDLSEIEVVEINSMTSDLTGFDNKLVTSDYNNYYITNLDTLSLEQVAPKTNYSLEEKVQALFCYDEHIYDCGGQQSKDIRIHNKLISKEDLKNKLDFSTSNFELEGACVKDDKLFTLMFSQNTFFLLEHSVEGVKISCENTGKFLQNGSSIVASQIKNGDIETFVYDKCEVGKEISIYSEVGLNLSFKGLKIEDYSLVKFYNINNFSYLLNYFAYGGSFSSIFNKNTNKITFQNLEHFKVGGFWFIKNNSTGVVTFRYVGQASAIATDLKTGVLPNHFKNNMNIYFSVFYQNNQEDVKWVGMEDGVFYNASSLPTGSVFIFGSYQNDYFTGSISSALTYSSLDTPYYALKMQQEGIYDDYVTYRDELHEYENSLATDETMLLPVLQEPVIPDSVKAFAEKYKLI